MTCGGRGSESCYLLRRFRVGVEAILDNVARGVIHVSPVLENSAASVQSIMRKYRDQSIDLADACLIHLADELDTGGNPDARQRFSVLPLAQDPEL